MPRMVLSILMPVGISISLLGAAQAQQAAMTDSQKLGQRIVSGKVQPGESPAELPAGLDPPDDPVLWRAWVQGYLACCSIVARSAQERVDAILNQERPAA